MSDLYLILRSRLPSVAEWVELGSDVMLTARKAQGLSRESVSRDLHVSTKTVERYESEGRIPRQLLPTYAKIVGLEIEEPARVKVTLDDEQVEAHLPQDVARQLADAAEGLAAVVARFESIADRL